jgi:hypothetical protein
MITIQLLFLIAILQVTFQTSYTGHADGWTDYNNDVHKIIRPVTMHLIESVDSTWATIFISEPGRQKNDTIIMRRISTIAMWSLVKWNSDTTFKDHPINFDISYGEIKINMGFGYSGASWYGRKD